MNDWMESGLVLLGIAVVKEPTVAEDNTPAVYFVALNPVVV